MLSAIRSFMIRFLSPLFLCIAVSCHSGADKVPLVYNEYKFDPMVIEKLPLYDSLASAILKSYNVLQNSIDPNAGYQAFRYMPSTNDTEVFKKLPQEAGPDMHNYFNRIGKDFIYGFDLFKDSTIKIYIRNTPSKTAAVDIVENLSYYPAGANIRKREFPVRDSILNKHWQYWTRFDEQSLF